MYHQNKIKLNIHSMKNMHKNRVIRIKGPTCILWLLREDYPLMSHSVKMDFFYASHVVGWSVSSLDAHGRVFRNRRIITAQPFTLWVHVLSGWELSWGKVFQLTCGAPLFLLRHVLCLPPPITSSTLRIWP